MYIALRRLLLFLSVFTLAEYSGVIQLGAFVATPNKLVTAMFLGVAAVGLVLESRRFPKIGKNWWMVAFYVSVLVSAVGSVVAGTPIRAMALGLVTITSVILFYFVIVWAIPQRRDLHVLLWALSLGAAFVCGSAILGFGRFVEGSTFTRASGFGGNPNRLGYVAAGALPLGVALFLSARGMMSRSVLAGASLVTLAGLLATLSRSALVSLAVMGLYGMYRFGRFDLLRYAPIPIFLAIAFIFVAPEQLTERIDTLTSAQARQEDASIQRRLKDLEYASLAFLSNPVTGVGFRRFGLWVNRNEDATYSPEKTLHNAYLQVLVNQGIVGFIPFMGILFFTWYDFWRTAWLAKRLRRYRDPDLQQLGHFALFGEIALVGSLIGNLFQPSVNYKLIWFLAAVSSVVLIQARARVSALIGDANTTGQVSLFDPEDAHAPARAVP